MLNKVLNTYLSPISIAESTSCSSIRSTKSWICSILNLYSFIIDSHPIHWLQRGAKYLDPYLKPTLTYQMVTWYFSIAKKYFQLNLSMMDFQIFLPNSVPHVLWWRLREGMDTHERTSGGEPKPPLLVLGLHQLSNPWGRASKTKQSPTDCPLTT